MILLIYGIVSRLLSTYMEAVGKEGDVIDVVLTASLLILYIG